MPRENVISNLCVPRRRNARARETRRSFLRIRGELVSPLVSALLILRYQSSIVKRDDERERGRRRVPAIFNLLGLSSRAPHRLQNSRVDDNLALQLAAHPGAMVISVKRCRGEVVH